MREHLARFFTALGYFSRLPVPAWVTWSPARLAHAGAWLPLVGWVVGAAGALAGALLRRRRCRPLGAAGACRPAGNKMMNGAYILCGSESRMDKSHADQ